MAAGFAAQAQAQAQSTPAAHNALPAVKIEGKSEQRRLGLDGASQTGSRLGLSLRETPASVEVIDQEQMERRGARTLEEALRGAAGLTVGGSPGSPGVASTRGFTGGFITYLFDGGRVSTPTMSNRPQDSWNYERIEVLKGPASVLYGEGGIGGAVNFVPKQPDRQAPGAQALLSYGSHGALRAAVGLGGALGDSGAYRVDYSRNQSDGWRPRSGSRMDHLTGALAFRPAADLRLDLSADWMRDALEADYGVPLVSAAFATEPTGVVSDGAGRVIDRRLTRLNYNVSDGRMDSDSLWLRARLAWQITPQWLLRNELSHYKADRMWRNSESYTFVAPDRIKRTLSLVSHAHQVLSNRLDLSHQGLLAGLANRFVIGMELSRTDFASQRRFSDDSAATNAALQVSALQPQAGVYLDNPALFTGAGNRTDVSTDVSTTALFAEDSIKLGEALTLVAGLRSERIKLERRVEDLNTAAVGSFGGRYRPDSLRLGAVYDWSPRSALYAQAVNAAAPVGSSNLLLQSAANAAFPLTRGQQYELGIKQSLPDSLLDWTLALYRIEQRNVLSRDPSKPALTVNNGQISSQGIELSAAWRATAGLTLSGNLALVDAQFDTLVETGGVSRVGKRPTNVPKQTARLWADYRLAGLPLSVGASLAHTGAMYTDNANLTRINGHTLLDLYASWRTQAALLSLRVRNAGDKLYASWTAANTSQLILGAPRSVELSAKFDF